MKRTIALTCLIIVVAMQVTAQDQLFKTDNTKLLVKVVEVGTTEVKYKLFDNLNGPTYIESKSNVSLIIYQNGQHQVITQGTVIAPENGTVAVTKSKVVLPEMTVIDSITYFRHSNSISINFLNFFNNELGVLFRREFFRSQFNIIIPVAFGVAKPHLTQTTYFQRNGSRIELGNKIIEGGFGIHYYPSLRTQSNYYIGPVIRYMQYNCTQIEGFNLWGYVPNSKSTTLTRWAFSITNGLIYRTRSRITTSMFASVGFKKDVVADPLLDLSGQPVETIPNEVSFYWWSGFEVGFNF